VSPICSAWKKKAWKKLTFFTATPTSGDEEPPGELSELEISKDAAVEDGAEENGVANPKVRKSLFSRLSSRPTGGEQLRVSGAPKGKDRSQSISDKASDWKNKLSKRITGSHVAAASMPPEEEVLAQFEVYVHSRGLEDQRSQLDVLSLEGKWNLLRGEGAAIGAAGTSEASGDSRQRHKNKRDPVKMVAKLVANPIPSKSEPLRQLIVGDSSGSHTSKLAEAHVVASLLSVLAVVEGKPRKTPADNEVMADVLASLKALMQHPLMLQGLLEGGGALVAVGCFDVSCETVVRVAAVSLLRALAATSVTGVQQVVAAFDAFSKTRLERARFEHLVGLFEASPEMSVRLSVAQLAMRMVDGTTDRWARLAIRNDFVNWGFKRVLAELAETAPDEFRTKFAEHLEEFRRQQTADGGVMAGSKGRGRSSSMSVDSTASLPIAGEAAPAGAVAANEPPGELVRQAVAELGSSNPKAAGLLSAILDNVLNGFGRAETSLWQWQCCERLTRMLGGLELQHLNANFDVEPSAASSPETALANLLLGAVMHDELQTLREQVFGLREELAQVAGAAEMTITDLQVELEIARKRKVHKRKVHKDKTLVLGAAAASPAPDNSSGPTSAVASPRVPVTVQLPAPALSPMPLPPAVATTAAALAPAPSPGEGEELGKSSGRRLRHTLKKKKHPSSHMRRTSGLSGAPALGASTEMVGSDNETAPSTPDKHSSVAVVPMPDAAPPSTPTEAGTPESEGTPIPVQASAPTVRAKTPDVGADVPVTAASASASAAASASASPRASPPVVAEVDSGMSDSE
jgi:hypothetical protein